MGYGPRDYGEFDNIGNSSKHYGIWPRNMNEAYGRNIFRTIPNGQMPASEMLPGLSMMQTEYIWYDIQRAAKERFK